MKKMKTNLINPLKPIGNALAMFAIVFGLVFISSCGDDEPDCSESTWYEDADGDGLGNPDASQDACEQPEGYVDNDDDDDDAQGEPTQTIWEIVENTEGLDSLEKYLNVYPDLVATLEASGTFTLFAPNNAAFISLLATPGFPQEISSINPDIIKNVLAYHISASNFLKADLTSGTEVTTASNGNEKIIVNADGTLKTGSSNQAIEIVDEDKKATNGVVHVVGSVLIPPTVGATLTPILGTNAGTLLLGADFSILGQLIMKADTFAASQSLPTLISILSADASLDPTKTHTVFAPTNATFEALLAGSVLDTDTLTGQQLYGIIANHIVIGDNNDADDNDIIDLDELTMGASFSTAASSGALSQNLTIYVLADQGDYTDIYIDSNGDVNPADPTTFAKLDAEIAAPNAAPSNNGTIHVIAGVLSPKNP